MGVKIFTVFRDMCNDNIKYASVIRAARGRSGPSSIKTALTGTRKHSFDIVLLKDYCSGDNAELFSVVVAE